MADISNDLLRELISTLKDRNKEYQKLEDDMTRTSDEANKERTRRLIEEENKRNAALRVIREAARKDLERELEKIDATEEEKAKKIEELETKYFDRLKDRTDAVVKARNESLRNEEAVYERLYQVRKQLNDLEGTFDDETEEIERQKEVNRLKVEEMRLEAAQYELKKKKEVELNNLQITLIKKLEEERNEAINAAEARRGEEGFDADSEIGNIVNNFNQRKQSVEDNKFITGLFDAAKSGSGGIEGFLISSAGKIAAEAFGPVLGTVIEDSLGNIISILKSIRKAQTEQVDAAMKLTTQYIGPINTRLQGTDFDFRYLVETMQNNLTTTTYVSQKKYLESLNTLIEQGVAYNVEERAMIMTIGDKIATTFNALDASLTRLIRLQQADLTRAALGSESSITTLLNSMFRDSSYMDRLYDDVNSTVLEATSQMNPDQTSSFTYAIQKWLGALYSVGLSDAAVRTIAEGINLLSTGDVSSLSGRADLQNLVALSANKANLSLSSMLTNGLGAQDVDDLMMAMIKYLADIANNTSSQVVKSEWADIVNLSISDLRAFSNLTSTDIATLYNTNNLGYKDSLTQVNNQMRYLNSRTSIQERLDNFMENMGVTFGFNIADNDSQYLGFMLPEYIDRLKNAMGLKGLGSIAMDALGLAMSFMPGGAVQVSFEAMAETFADMIQSLFNGGFGVDLNGNSWNSSAYNSSRGANYSGLTGVRMSSSASGGATYADYASVANFEQTQARIEASGVERTEKVEEVSDTMDKLYEMLFEKQTVPVKVYIENGSSEFFKEVENAVDKSADKLSDDMNRYINNSSMYVQNLTNALYNIRSI